MLLIVLASARPEAWSAFAAALASDPEVQLKQVATGTEALEAGPTFSPHLMVIDYLPDTEPLSLVQKLLTVNAMVNTAVVSPLADRSSMRRAKVWGFSVVCRQSPELARPPTCCRS